MLPAEGSTATGQCGNETQSISISWQTAEKKTDKVDIEFYLNATSKSYHVSKMSATVFIPNANGN